MSEDKLVGGRLTILKVHAKLWEREKSVHRCSSNGAGCASLGRHAYVYDIALEVCDRLVPDLLVENVGRTKLAVLAARRE